MSEYVVSSDQLKALLDGLKAAGYSPFLGNFGVGGQLSTGPGALGPGSSAVLYFNLAKEDDAKHVVKIVSAIIHVSNLLAKFVDPQMAEKYTSMILDDSGLDMQFFVDGPLK
jgi:hypothetical protein